MPYFKDGVDVSEVESHRDRLFTALWEARSEAYRQVELWGVQHHPVHQVIGRPTYSAGFRARADEWKRINALRVDEGRLSWDGILLEEVFEALAETDPKKQREELIQTAAVALSMVADIDSKTEGEN